MVASIILFCQFAPQMALQQRVKHSLSSSFHGITCVMQLFLPELPEQAFEFDIFRMKKSSEKSFNMFVQARSLQTKIVHLSLGF